MFVDQGQVLTTRFDFRMLKRVDAHSVSEPVPNFLHDIEVMLCLLADMAKEISQIDFGTEASERSAGSELLVR
ncbi:hypothetical protein [Mesorhizobium wenxiniae]|uniref:hypothetical protein n=1 Tax=Mesorhizobium wenxiniae TaxID=2014805 RepID=UPI001FDA6D66|nr:hypothetical protein [Mesorhizobium wenxiniae]